MNNILSKQWFGENCEFHTSAHVDARQAHPFTYQLIRIGNLATESLLRMSLHCFALRNAHTRKTLHHGKIFKEFDIHIYYNY